MTDMDTLFPENLLSIHVYKHKCVCNISPLPVIPHFAQSQQTWCTTHTYTHIAPPLNTPKGKRKKLGAKQIKVINDNIKLL